jgi:hypothetical protein
MARLITNSEAIHLDIQRLAVNLDVKLVALEAAVRSQQRANGLESVNHLKATVTSAATVMSSKTTMRSKPDDESSDIPSYMSDFGDWFHSESASTTLQWIYSDVRDQPLFNLSMGASPVLTPTSPFSIDSNDALTSRFAAVAKSSNNGNLGSNEKSSGIKDIYSSLAQKPAKTSQTLSSDSLALPKSTAKLDGKSRSRLKNLSVSSILRATKREDSLVISTKKQRNKAIILPQHRKIKIVPVGDGACGKTCFIKYVFIFSYLIIIPSTNALNCQPCMQRCHASG